MASKQQVLTKFSLELLKKLPLGKDNISQFSRILEQHGLLPGNSRDTLLSKDTTAHRADYLIDIVTRDTDINFPELIDAMKEYSTQENDPVLRDLVKRMQDALDKLPKQKVEPRGGKADDKQSESPEDTIDVKKLWSEEDLKNKFDSMDKPIYLPEDKRKEVLEKVTLLLLTVNGNETAAVRSYMEPLDGHNGIYQFSKRLEYANDHAIYHIGKFGSCPAAITVIPAGLEARGGAISVPIIAHATFPYLGGIIALGVACGVREKVKMCDVLVSTQVADYNRGRVESSQISSRGTTIDASPYFKKLFSGIVKWPNDDTIKKRLAESKMPNPKIIPGVILSGPYLIDDEEFKEMLVSNFAKRAIGLEMEGGYLFAATQQLPTHVIVVKAVCDFGDGKKNKLFQPTAALLAADFVHEKLSDPQVSDMISGKKENKASLNEPQHKDTLIRSGGTFDCDAARKLLRKNFFQYGNLSYSNMSGLLYSHEVITRCEKEQIDHKIGSKQMEAVLDIVMDSLEANQTEKYRGLLLAMEKSQDTLLRKTAKELGGSHSVPE